MHLFSPSSSNGTLGVVLQVTSTHDPPIWRASGRPTTPLEHILACAHSKQRRIEMSTSILSTLKLTAARKSRALPDVVKRRNKLLQKLAEQRELAAAFAQGQHYAPRRLRSMRDEETGARVVKEVSVRIKPWFWTGEKGETLLAINYGSKQIELLKGKTAIDVGDTANLVMVLDTVISAVKSGELDVQIEATSVKLREGFKK